MTIERRVGLPTENYAAAAQGNPEALPWAQEAAFASPETSSVSPGIEVEIVDVAAPEADKLEAQRARARAYTHRRYHETKQAALAGDEDAQQRWQRMQALNRAGQRRWRATHPEDHRANQRESYRRRTLSSQQLLNRPDSDASE